MVINILLIAAIIVGIIGIIFCLKKDKAPQQKQKASKPAEKRRAKTTAIILLGIVAASTVAILVRSAVSNEPAANETTDELFYSRASGFVLGQHLAKTFPDSNALIVVPDRNAENPLLSEALGGLKEGIGKSITIAALDSPSPAAAAGKTQDAGELKKMSPERMLYLSRKMEADSFNKMVDRHMGCNLIISLQGLPKDLSKVLLFNYRPESRPKIALLSTNIGALKDRIAKGDISASVISRPEFVPGKGKAPKDIEAAFNQRFLLVTPGNIKNVASEHPELFKK